MAPSAPPRDGTRSAVVEAAARLLRDAGGDAVTTRAVAEAAGVQSPTLYRLFGDKDGLLEAVVEHELAAFVASKAAQVRAAADADDDPVADLRDGWHRQIEFGLTHPAVFALLSDPARAARSAAARSGREVLAARVHRVALAGRLRVGERHAAELVHAAGTGAVLALLAVPPAERDPELSAAMLQAVLRQVLVDPAEPAASAGLLPAVVALRAGAAELTALTAAEQQLLAQWLDRVVAGG